MALPFNPQEAFTFDHPDNGFDKGKFGDFATPPEYAFNFPSNVNLTDLIALKQKDTVADNLNLTDSVRLIRNFQESLGLTDQVNKKFIKSFNDTENLLEELGLQDNFPIMGMSKPFQQDMGWRDIINTINVTVEERNPRIEYAVWTLRETFTVPVGQSIVFKAVADDPFISAVTPVPGFRFFSGNMQSILPNPHDYIVNQGTISVSLDRTSGQSCNITVTNTGAVDAIVEGMRVRANSLIVTRSVTVNAVDQGSVVENGIKSFQGKMPWAGVNDVRAVAEVILGYRFKRLPIVHFSLKNSTPAKLRSMLELKLSDRINIVEDETFTNHDFFIEQVEHKISGAGNYHTTVIGCEQVPIPTEGGFTFDEPSLGFSSGKFGDRSNEFNFGENLFILGQSTLGSNEVLGL